jgi:membrane protease YdiL (CAAX protease family)
VPLIIGISLALALASIALLVRRRVAGLAQFGFRWPDAPHAVSAMMIGAPLALIVAWLAHVLPSKSPLDTSGFPLWMLALYFGIGSPLQEEVVFRGLLQSVLAQHWTAMRSVAGLATSAPVLFTTALFGIVHLGSGVAVFVGALVLGLAAGELRRRSGSLAPAMIVHVLFNIPGLTWR